MADTISGNAGANDILDLYYATSATTVSFSATTAFAGTATGGGLGTGSFTLIERIYGGLFADTVMGGSGEEYLYLRDGNDVVSAGAGNDLHYGDLGDDTLSGGAGLDRITGGAGRDTMTGNTEADTFAFASAAGSGLLYGQNDTITDFVSGTDKIDLSVIDANVAGDQAFTFIVSGLMTATPGQSRYVQYDNPDVTKDYTEVRGDFNGDLAADFNIRLNGLVTLAAADFVL